MRDLFWSEVRRFRMAALAAAAVHGLVLGVLAISDEVFLATPERLFAAAVGYALAGLALGLYQWGSYRRRDLWVFLLHRPLSPRRIFLALCGGAAALLATVVLLPLAAAAGLVALGADGVDPRHLLLGPYAWGLALACYLVAALVVLTPWRGTFLVAVLALPVLLPGPLGAWVFAPLGAALAWLGLLAAAAVRPDLDSPPRPRAATAAATVPALYVVFLVLCFGALFLYSLQVAVAEQGWRSFARHSWNEYFPAGSHPRIGYLEPRAALAHGLELGGAARHDVERLGHVEVLEIAPQRTVFGRRHQPLFLDRAAIVEEDAARRRWTFRHDRLGFLGRDRRGAGSLGWTDGTFPGVPRVEDEVQVMTPGRLYRFDGGARRAHVRYALPEGERFLSAVLMSPAFDAALSDRALYLFAPGEWLGTAELRPAAVVELPGRADNLDRALVASDGDGYLVSFVFGTRSERDFAEARQVVQRVEPGGRSQTLADAPLSPGLPAWARHRGFLISPALQTLDDLVRSALYGRGPRIGNLDDLRAQRLPRGVVAGAASVALAAAAAAWMLATRRGLGRSSRRAWAIAALLLGLPVPFAMFLLTSRPS